MKLRKEYNKDGYILKYIKHEGDVYLYNKTGIKEDWMDKDPSTHWEVVIASKRTGSSPAAGKYGYPSDSDWGTKGWTLMTIERAEMKFIELVEKNKMDYDLSDANEYLEGLLDNANKPNE